MYPAYGCTLSCYHTPRRGKKKYRTDKDRIPFIIQNYKKDKLEELLFQASFEGNYYFVDELLKAGVDINANEGDALKAVLYYYPYNFKMAEYLVSKGLIINDKHLRFLSETENIKGINFLFKYGKFNNDIMEHAFLNNLLELNEEMCDIFVQKGVNITKVRRMKQIKTEEINLIRFKNELKKGSLFFIGLILVALGSVYMIKTADLGVQPFDVLNIGMSDKTFLTIGKSSILIGMLLLLISFIISKQKLKIGTILDTIFLGTFIDLFLYLDFILIPETIVLKFVYLSLGTTLIAFGAALTIFSELGAEPIDTFMKQKNEHSSFF